MSLTVDYRLEEEWNYKLDIQHIYKIKIPPNKAELNNVCELHLYSTADYIMYFHIM